MEKWLIPGLRQEIHERSLEHLIVPKSKEVLKSKTKQKNKNGDVSKGHRSDIKALPIVKAKII